MTKKITDLEGRLESAFNRADSIPHTITLTRAELQAEWDRACELVKRLTEALRETSIERDIAESEAEHLRYALEDMLEAYENQAVTPQQCEAENQARKFLSPVEKQS